MPRTLVAVAAVCLMAAAANAQTPSNGVPDLSTFRVRLGPLWLNPGVDVTNIGVDTNVFNEPVDQNPKRDFTAVVVPKTQVWMRIGETWIASEVDEELVWYQKYTSERSANSTVDLAWKVPLNRLSFEIGGRYLNTRDRPGFEIDARSRRTETTFRGRAEVRALSKTYFGVEGSRLNVDFDKDATFLGASLHLELNRVVTNGGVTVRQQVTPLTSIAIEASREEDRFEFSPLRNSNSNAAAMTVTFDPAALIKGSVKVGYRDFQPVDPSLPGYRGATAAVNVTYVLLGTTKFGVQATRDVQYSFDINQPYYLQTGVGGSVDQQIVGPVDVLVRGSLDHLAYRDRIGGALAASNRTDSVVTYGAGIGYHLGPDLRIGFNVENATRSSVAADRQYQGLTFGTSVTYGF